MNGIDAMIYSKAISAHNVPASVSLGRVITVSEGILCITSAPSKKEYTVKGRTWIHNCPWNLANHLTAGSNKNATELSEGACNYAGFSRFLKTYKKWSKWRPHDRQAQGIICVHLFSNKSVCFSFSWQFSKLFLTVRINQAVPLRKTLM